MDVELWILEVENGLFGYLFLLNWKSLEMVYLNLEGNKEGVRLNFMWVVLILNLG